MSKSSIKYNIGDTLEVETFAGPTIHKKVLSPVEREFSWKDGEKTHLRGFNGCFVRRRDLQALREAHVPYSGREVLKKTISFTYDWQVLRLVKKGDSNGC